jgi:CheY-like chemotaxis protein
LDSQPRLLLVDDDALNREVALDQLKELGISADVAVDGEIAVAMAGETSYDLILMDIQMPVMDGREACRRILALPGRRQTPIIALTANILPESRTACLAAGMVDYLEKPVTNERLRSCLACWLPAARLVRELEAADGGIRPLLDALEEAGGFAPASALEVLGIRPEKYPTLLLKYLAVHGETLTKTRAALQAGDLQLAKRLVHTLKGTTATLGLTATCALASRLDKVLEGSGETETINNLLSELAATDRQQRATLQRLLAPLRD